MQRARSSLTFTRMFRLTTAALCVLTQALPGAPTPAFPANPTGWPEVTSQNKPWTRWWWLGSGVDKANLTRELEDFAKTGIGGVEICPIYGAMGAEDRFIDFLSPKWMEMLAHTTTEAKRLGIGVDMTTGTGWPFGGPMVTEEMSSCGLHRIQKSVEGGKRIKIKIPTGKLECLLAFPEVGPAVDLADHVKSGSLDWAAPAGKWTVSGITAEYRIQKVKRAAPGGDGEVLDPYSPEAMNAYLTSFDRAFETYQAPKPRAQFHDSFEYYGADWRPLFLDAFKAGCHYDLRDQLPAFNGIGDPDTVARVRADYRATLGELHKAYLETWHRWALKHSGVTRNQAHGSPGNLLDHYAVSDIPETEIFRSVGEDQIPMLRFAASAANAKGGNLVSSESFTWLGEHFQVTPEKLKEAADFVFLGGVNHLFFHGIPYSPQDAKWPGWLFYASTHMGPNGGLWHDLPAFTGYLQRCQSILQEGKPTSEVLVYFPYQDLIHNGAEKLPLFTVHNQTEWLHPTPFYQTTMELWNHGVTFDFASDEMMMRTHFRDGKIELGGNRFKAIVLPAVKHLSTETFGHLADLVSQGAKIIVLGGMPDEVPGFFEQAKRRGELQALETQSRSGFLSATGSVLPVLDKLGAMRETMTESGLRFVRRSHDEGFHYFIVNRSGKAFDGPLQLAAPFKCAVVLDPWHPEQSGVVPSKTIPLHLEPLQSVIVRTYTDKIVEGKPWIGVPATAAATPINGPWKLEFTQGGPSLPKSVEIEQLGSWTTLTDPAVSNFSGTGRYSTSFEFKGSTADLDLGKVANTARVYLNGAEVGISWCEPHILDISKHLKPGRNELAIEVTNLAANRIAYLDRRKVPWKQFHEINFVNIDYKPFDASNWPALESGLIGPVRLIPGSNP